MTHSTSDHNQHLSRLHHHRNRVSTARAAVNEAVRETVAAHYAQRRTAGPGDVTTSPESVSGQQVPSSAPQPASGPPGAGNEGNHE